MTPKEAKSSVRKWNRRTSLVWDTTFRMWKVILTGARVSRDIGWGNTEDAAWLDAAKKVNL